jgi:hypothetical protein
VLKNVKKGASGCEAAWRVDSPDTAALVDLSAVMELNNLKVEKMLNTEQGMLNYEVKFEIRYSERSSHFEQPLKKKNSEKFVILFNNRLYLT